MIKKAYVYLKNPALFLFIAIVALLFGSTTAISQDFTDNIRVGGRLVERISFNTQDPPETKQDDRWEPSMVRSTAYVDLKGFYNLFDFTVIGRVDREIQTEYLQRLDDLSGADLDKFYNDADFREYYVDFSSWDRVNWRIGKQQVVWGRTDFFQAMDIIHGYDFSWRSFLEPENEYLRKPLVMANAEIDVPEANGVLQLIWVPGEDFNEKESYGHTYDLRGGRWALQPNKGLDFFTDANVPMNYHHVKGDVDDDHYGFRWSSGIGDVEYSLAYFHGNNQDPVVNSIFDPYGEAPENEFAEFIFPKVDLIGGTANYYLQPPFDMVIRTEIAYIFDKPYNVDQNFVIPGTQVVLPGFNGIEEYDTVKLMIGIDKPMGFVRWLGARKDGFFTMQLFDTWLLDYDEDDDDVVRLAGYGAAYDEHDTLLTGVLGWNYAGDTINPQLAGGYDLSNGDSFLIPSINFVYGNNWRLHLEYDIFFPDDSKSPGEVENDTELLGWFENNNQFYMRLTYLF